MHGLGYDPKKSWVWKAHSNEEKRTVKAGLQNEKVNWLKDLLPKDLPKARVLAFNYESRWWDKDASSQRTDTCSRLMLRALHDPNHQVSNECSYTGFADVSCSVLAGKKRLPPYDIYWPQLWWNCHTKSE